MSVTHFRLVPPGGWECFTHHIELSDFLYDQIIPVVNKGEYSFLNLFAGFGVFKDDVGNSVFILFDDSKKKERIIELRVSQLIEFEDSKGLLLETMEQIVKDYSLEKLYID